MRQRPIGETVKAWREARGFSQRGLAERAGIGYVIIARLELGQTDPRLSTLTKLAEALGENIPALFTPPAKAKRMRTRREKR